MSSQWAAPGPVMPEAPEPAPGTPPPAERDPVSVAALVAGVLPTGPVAVVLGVLSVRRTRRRRRRGRPLALAGLVLGLAWSLTAVVLLPPMIEGPVVEGDASGRIEVTAENLRRGNCVEELPDGRLTEVTVVPCAEPHRAQVVADGELGSDGSGADEAQSRAQEFCADHGGDTGSEAEPVTLLGADAGRVVCLGLWPEPVTQTLVR